MLLLNGFERTILQPNFWKEALVKGDFYDAGLPGAVVDVLLGAIWPDEDFLATVLPAAELRPLIPAWIPPHWLQTQTEAFIDAIFVWLEDESLYPRISVDVRPIKQGFTSESAFDLALIVFERLPECRVEDLLAFGGSALLGTEISILCRPPDSVGFDLEKQIVNAVLVEVAQALPDELDVSPMELMFSDAAVQRATQPIKAAVYWTRLLAWWGFALPLVLLLVTMVFGVRSLAGWGRWWGVPVMIGGLLVAVFAWTLPLLVDWLLPIRMPGVNSITSGLINIFFAGWQIGLNAARLQVTIPALLVSFLGLLWWIGMEAVSFAIRSLRPQPGRRRFGR